jgi:hypothetical protein
MGAFDKDAALSFCQLPQLPRIVGVAGYAKSGKSTVADYLIRDGGFRRLKFADGLKDMLRAMGLDEAQIEGDQKETPADILCGKTPRQAMQSLGTEWGRKCMGDDLWVNLWQERVRRWLALHPMNRVVVDDVRFPNELQRVLKMGGTVLRIDRPGVAPTNSHASETAIDDAPGMIHLVNDGGIEELQAEAVRVLSQ